MDFVLFFGSLSSCRSQTFSFTILTDCMHIFHETNISVFSGPPACYTYLDISLSIYICADSDLIKFDITDNPH